MPPVLSVFALFAVCPFQRLQPRQRPRVADYRNNQRDGHPADADEPAEIEQPHPSEHAEVNVRIPKQQRGQVLSSATARQVVATIHPSAVLRAPDSEGRRAAYEMLVSDLRVVANALKTRRT